MEIEVFYIILELGDPFDFIVDILAAISIRTIALDEIGFAWLGLIAQLEVGLLLEFILAVGKAAFSSELAAACQVECLAELCFEFFFIILNKFNAVLIILKLFSFWFHVDD